MTWEQINKSKIIYLAYDCELMPMLITANLFEIKRYCAINKVNYSIYPIGTYSNIN